MIKSHNSKEIALNHVLLGVILMGALTYRFLDLGSQSLWNEGLVNAFTASEPDFLNRVINGTDQPPGYPFLLRLLEGLSPDSDALLPFPSALASLLSVFLIYRLGKNYFSKSAGLLAAAMLAGAFREVLYSQNVEVYPLFTCATLIHIDFFLQIFGKKEGLQHVVASSAPWKVSVGGFTLDWRSTVPRDVVFFRAFWISGFAVLCLHTMGMAVIASEAIIALMLCIARKQENTGLMLRRAFLPLFLACLCWVSALSKQLARIISVNNSQPTYDGWESLRFLCGPDVVRPEMVLAGLTLSIIVMTYFQFVKKDRVESGVFLTLLGFLLLTLLFFVIAQVLIPSIQSKRALLFVCPLLFLLASCGIATLLENIKYPYIAVLIMVVMILAIFGLHLDKNRKAGLLMASTANVRGAVQAVLQDSEFMNSSRRFLMSHDFIEYYVRAFGIRVKDENYIFPWSDSSFTGAENLLNTPENFYYIELLDPRDGPKGSPLLQKMVSQYSIVCESNFNQVLLVKFNTRVSPPSTPPESFYLCPYDGKPVAVNPAASTNMSPGL